MKKKHINSKYNEETNIMHILSNNSHELFHSNLWAWLIENDHNFVKVFFKDFNVDNFASVEREKYNMDLVIIDKDENYYIIENKVKSIPNMNQLNNYKSKIIDKDIKCANFLLVSLIEPFDKNIINSGWDILVYSDLQKSLRKAIIKSDKYIIKKYKNFLLEYCAYLKYIVKIVKNNRCVNDECYYIELGKELKDNSLKDILKKVKLELLKEYLNKHLLKYEDMFSKFGYTYKIFCNLYNTKPTLTIRVCDKGTFESNKKHQGIEIQIEGKQYRHMVRVKKNSNKSSWVSALKIFEKTGFICSRNKIIVNDDEKIIWGKTSSMKDEFCTYSGKYDGDIDGVYQYYDLTDIKYKDLANIVKDDFDKIYKRIISNGKFKKFFKNHSV